jgi:hypothetical protein
MFKIIVVAFIFLMLVYYMDIIVRIVQDEKAKKMRYKGIKLIVPFAYWLFPYKEKKPKRKVKPKKSKQNEAK